MTERGAALETPTAPMTRPPHPTKSSSTAPKRRSRWGRRVLAASLVLAGTTWLCTQGFVARLIVTSLLSSRLGVPVRASSVALGFDGVVTIRHARILAPSTGAAIEFVHMDELSCRSPWWALWTTGGPPISDARIDGFTLRVSQSAKDGSVNIPAFTMPASRSGGDVPSVEITRALIELGEHDTPEGYRVLRRIGARGSLVPGTDPGSLVFRLQEDSPESSGSDLLLAGSISAGSVQGAMTGLTLDSLAPTTVPTAWKSLFAKLDLRGEIARTTFSYDLSTSPVSRDQAVRGIVARVELKDVAVTLPFEAFASATDRVRQFPRLVHTSGTITIAGGEVRADLAGTLEDFPYTVDLAWHAPTLDAPFDCTLVSKGFQLQATPQLSPFLPPQVRRRLDMFSQPTATVDSRVVVSRKVGEISPRFTGQLEFKDGTASFHRFPYLFSNMRGLVEFDDDSLRLVRIAGEASSGAAIVVSGSIAPLTDEAAVSLDISVTGVPVDEMLEHGLGPRRGPIISALFSRERHAELRQAGLVRPADAPGDARASQFAFGGVGNVRMKLETPFGRDMPWTQIIDIDIPEAGLVPRRFPLPIVARNVRLNVDDTTLTVVGGEFSTLHGGTARVSARADFGADSTDGKTDVNISANAVPFDELLIHAIPARDRVVSGEGGADARTLGQILTDLHLVGTGDATIWIGDEGGADGDVTFKANVEFAHLTAAPETSGVKGPSLRDGAGTLIVDEHALSLTLHGKLAPGTSSARTESTLNASLAANFDSTNGGDPALDTSVSVTGLDAALPIENTIAVFSPGAARVLADLRSRYSPTGTLDASTRVMSSAQTPLDLDVSLFPHNAFAFTYRSTIDGIAPARVELGIPNGLVRVRGASESTLTFEDFSAPIAVDSKSCGVLSLRGSLALPTTGPAGELDVSLRTGAFESPLTTLVVHDRLGERFAAFFDSRRPAGTFDLELALRRAPGDAGSPWRVDGTLHPKTLAFNSETFTRVECPEASGVIRFSRDDGVIDALALRHADWSATIAGGWSILPDGSSPMNLRIAGESKGIPDSLIAILPKGVRDLRTDLKIAADGMVEYRDITLGLGLPARADEEIAATVNGVVQFHHLSADVGVELSKADGTVKFDATKSGDGRSTFSMTAHLERSRVANVQITGGKALAMSGEHPGQVLIPHLSADCHDGRLWGDADLSPVKSAEPDGPKHFRSRIALSGIGLDGVLADMGGNPTPATTRPALLDGDISLAGVTGDLSSRRGRGLVFAGGGEVLTLPLLLPLIQVSNLQIPSGERLDAAKASFYISGRTIAVERISVFSPTVELRGYGTMTWPDLALDLVFNSRATSRVPIITSILEGFRDELVTTSVKGTPKDPKVSLQQFRGTLKALDELFGTEDKGSIMAEMERQSRRNSDRLRIAVPIRRDDATEPSR